MLQWLTPHWQSSAAELAADPDRHNWKSGLQEWSQGQGLGLPSYRCEERSQGNNAGVTPLLSQATQPSDPFRIAVLSSHAERVPR